MCMAVYTDKGDEIITVAEFRKVLPPDAEVIVADGYDAPGHVIDEYSCLCQIEAADTLEKYGVKFHHSSFPGDLTLEPVEPPVKVEL